MTSVKREELNKTIWVDENGLHHREDDLPAIVSSDGWKYWMIHGKQHRTTGPAVIAPPSEYTQQTNYWFVVDVRTTSAKQFQELTGHSDEKMAELLMKFGDIE